MQYIYRLVAQNPNTRTFNTVDTDLLSIQALVSGVETSSRLRDDLQGQPKLIGYLGPMWDGYSYKVGDELIPGWKATDLIKANAEKVGIIRYETESVYDLLSR